MKTIIVLLISCFLFTSCIKKGYSNDGKQEQEKQEVTGNDVVVQEKHDPYLTFAFDIDSFKYLDEFPRTIDGIKEMYPDEHFQERISENWGKGPIGEFIYSLDSPNIKFGFWGDTVEDAILLTVEIFNSAYQCRAIQVIGMNVEELESISGKKLNRDKNVRISTELYVLSIKTEDGFVKNYAIVSQL